MDVIRDMLDAGWGEKCKDCAAKDAELEDYAVTVAALRAKEKVVEAVTHCDKCGGTWYDGGLTPSCPSCRIHELEQLLLDAVVDKDAKWAVGKDRAHDVGKDGKL